MSGLVLDSEAVSRLMDGPPKDLRVRAAMRAASNAGGVVTIPAAALAEHFTTDAHRHRTNAFLNREHEAFDVRPTDVTLARNVGRLLQQAGRGSEDHVDACVVAASMERGGGLILTSDPADIRALIGGLVTVNVESV